MLTTTILSFILPIFPLATAHFTLDSPPARGFDESTLIQFPCGNQNTPSSDRTPFPLTGGPIQLTMEHAEAAVQVLLGLGPDPGSNFNITLVPTIQEQGIGKFCLGDVMPPAGMGIEDGMNATIQVVTNGDPTGGLYNCADITFSSTAQPGGCKNGTGVKSMPYKGKATNANGTSSGTQTGTMSGSMSGTAAAPASTGSMGSGAGITGVGIKAMVGGLVIGGAAMVL